jgi:hypothetical protein
MAGSSPVGLRQGCSNLLSRADSEDKKWLGEFDRTNTRSLRAQNSGEHDQSLCRRLPRHCRDHQSNSISKSSTHFPLFSQTDWSNGGSTATSCYGLQQPRGMILPLRSQTQPSFSRPSFRVPSGIPGPTITGCAYGFRARRLAASRNDIRGTICLRRKRGPLLARRRLRARPPKRSMSALPPVLD